ncbi:MAG: glycosyltransferase [Acidobacteriota bacterium]
MEQVLFLYLVTEGFPPTVFDSQVLEHVRLMERYGVQFDLVVFERLLAFAKNRHRNARRAAEVRTAISGRLTQGVLATTFLGWDLWLPRLQLQKILEQLGPLRRCLIHARTQTAAALAVGLKRRHPGLRVVFDMRGDTVAEFLLNARESGSPVDSYFVRQKATRLRAIEASAVEGSDAMICVCEAMKEAVLGRYPIEPGNITVIPTVASPDRFYWDPALRAQVRQSLGWDEKFVLVYSGSLRAYQSANALGRLAAFLQAQMFPLHLLTVTPQVREAENVLTAQLPRDQFTVVSSSFNEMVRWLNAADAGCLLRDQDPVNHVAAPTKFAEYLLCGLPVILTSGIGDYSNLVEKESLGLVVGSLHDFGRLRLQWTQLKEMADTCARSRIAAFGKQRFSSSVFAKTFLSLYERVLR